MGPVKVRYEPVTTEEEGNTALACVVLILVPAYTVMWMSFLESNVNVSGTVVPHP